MRLILVRILFLTGLYFAFLENTSAQSCVRTGINGTVFNYPCNVSCSTLVLQVPHLKTTSDYVVNQIPYAPYTYVAGGAEDLDLYRDDRYSNTVNLPFSFCFYDSVFTKVVIGSNGLITFDALNGSGTCFNAWNIVSGIPLGGGTQCSSASTSYYPRAAIMGVFSDLDPRPEAPPTVPSASPSPPDRKIEWRTEGSAPCRRFIVSFYRIGTYGAGNYSNGGANCNSQNPTTFQLVIYESTGLIEVFIENKNCIASSSSNAILGVQDWSRTRGVAAPGKNASPWSATNEGYRFTPNGGVSRFVSSQLLTIGGAFIANADTVTTTQGLLDIRFPNTCQALPSSQYIIRTTFSSCAPGDPDLVSNDTITINRTNSLNATANTTGTVCGPPSGTITGVVPPGIGTPPYSYVLDGGAAQGSNLFNNVTAGAHTLLITDFTGGCTSTINVIVSQSGVLTAGISSTAAICNNQASGTITITPTNGLAPYSYTLNGGPPVSSGNFTGLIPGNYTVVLNDASGCTATYPLTVAAGPPLPVGLSSSATSCAGVNNGTITLTPTAGTGPYTYTLNGGAPQPGNVFTGLAPALYTVTATDALGCSSGPLTLFVNQGSALTGTAVATPTSCNGATNGTITATATSGAGPYTYQLDGGAFQPGNTFTNVATGNHTVIIRDGAGCQTNAISVFVGNGPPISGTTAVSNTSCAGANNGSITVTPTTGTGPFQYSINGGPFQTSNIFAPLAPATYTIQIQDGAGCLSISLPAIVANGAGLTGTATATATSCSGATNGSITVTATSGSGPYTYALDGGAFQPGNTFTGIAAGNHTVVIRDGAGCQSATIPVTVASGAGLTGTVTSTPTSCNGAVNGTITATPTNGSTPYTYALDGGVFQTGNTFTGIAAGGHTVIIRDGAGCQSAPIPVTVASGAILAGAISVNNTSCAGATNGSVTITITNGNSPYSYSFNGGPFVTTNIFSNLAPGTYTIVGQDGAGCQTPPINAVVLNGGALTATATTTLPSCQGAVNGSITVTPTSGSGPYQYSLNGGANQGSNIFTNLAAGSYTVVVTDGAGCISAPVPVTINPGPAMVTTVTKTDVSCNGGNNGSITVTAPAMGTGPFAYSLDNISFQPGNVFNGLTAGSYTVYYRSTEGCLGSTPVTISQPAVLTVSATFAPVVCNGQSNGVITATGSGGTAPYFYSTDNISFAPANTFNVPAGTYTIYIRDSRNCTSSTPVTVTEPAVLTATATTANASCAGGADGLITVTATGGNGGYQYAVNGGATQSSNVFNLVPGSYTVTVTDNKGCSYTLPAPAVVGLTNNQTLTPGRDTTICEGGAAQLNVVTNATQFSWSPAATLSDATLRNPVARPVVTTQYVVLATFGNCSATDTVMVFVNPAPVADAGPDGDICYGQSYTLQGSGGVSFSWSPGTSLSSTTIANPVSNPAQTIQYALRVTDNNNCTSLNNAVVRVNVTPPIVVQTNFTDTVVAAGDQFQLVATSAGTSYLWSPSAGLDNPAVFNPVVTAASDITYKVEATTSAGCKGEAYVTVRIFNGPEIYVPTGFTPNGDGRNDRFTPFPVGIREIRYFRVFNRWGQMLFSTSKPRDGWDGTSGGAAQPSGTYVWVVEGVTRDGKVITKKGTVMLIR